MEINAIILESEEGTAKTLLNQIESLSQCRCAIAANTDEAKVLISKYPKLQFLFCVYDVSSNAEQIREQAVSYYIQRNFPEITVCAIGSIKKEEVTLSERKVLLFDNAAILDVTKAVDEKKQQKPNLKIKQETFKKRGVHVVH